MNKDDELDKILENLVEFTDNETADVQVFYLDDAKQAIKASYRHIDDIRDAIGEDEKHQDTSFGGSLPAFETEPQKHRNQLKSEIRQALNIGDK